MQLTSRVECCADEITYSTPSDLYWSSSGGCWLLELRGRDTTGGEGKPRGAYLPADTKRDLYQYQRDHDLDDDPYIDSPPRRCPSRGLPDHRRGLSGRLQPRPPPPVCPASPRRRRNEPLCSNALGGWSPFSAIKPYLNGPSPEIVDEAFASVCL